jgi:predicted enzyme related to lactoylglutathione lyase
VFGWKIHERHDGTLTFDDAVGEVSGAWNRSRRPSDPGLLIYIMVGSIEDVLTSVEKCGGERLQEIRSSGSHTTAQFRDPSGNVLGLYQEG